MSNLQNLDMYDDTKVLIDPNDDSILDFSEIEALAHNKDDIIANYILKDPNVNILSPQIETFAPCSANTDTSRTNMSAKQLLQLVTSVNTDIPYMINKNYRTMTDVNSPFIEFAPHDGIIVFSKYDFLIVYYPKLEKLMPYHIPAFKKLTSNALSKRYQVGLTDDKKNVKAGDMLYDYTGQVNGSHMPKIGYRAKVLMTQFFGFTADDGFVMRKSFADKTRIEYARKIFIPISKELIYYKNVNGKYFYHKGEKTPKFINNYIKVDSSESFLREIANTTEKQSKLYGKKIESEPSGRVKKVKVHKLNKDKTFDELESEYIYTRGIIEEVAELYKVQADIKVDLYKTLSNVLPQDQAIEFTNKMFMQYEMTTKLPFDTMQDMCRDFGINQESIDFVLEVEVLSSNNTTRGDKFANLFAGKGVCSLILPDHLMPGDADIIFNPLGSFGRNNWGTMFELGISRIIEDIENQTSLNRRQNVIDRLTFIANKYVRLYDEKYANDILDLCVDIDSNDNVWTAFKADYVKHNGLYLFVENFTGVKFKDFINSFVFEYEKLFKINVTKKEKIVYSKELMQYMRDEIGFVSSVFGKDYCEEVEQMAYIGKAYWIKLQHTSNSKHNALGMSKYYSTQTGDPNRGAKNSGGQKLSWQSSAALLGHDHKNPIIKEYYGVKSSAVEDKNNYISKMIKDGEYTMKQTYYSPTTSTLNCFLAMSFMRFHDYDPVYIDQTISMLQDGTVLEDDDITFMLQDIDAIEDDMKTNPEKYQDEEDTTLVERESLDIDENMVNIDSEEDEDEEKVMTIEDLFDESYIDDIDKLGDNSGLEDDL